MPIFVYDNLSNIVQTNRDLAGISIYANLLACLVLCVKFKHVEIVFVRVKLAAHMSVTAYHKRMRLTHATKRVSTALVDK